MKKIHLKVVIPFLTLLFFACKKGNEYYYDYKSDEIIYDGSILSYLESQPGVYDSLLLVLDRVPDLRKKLNDLDADMTLFAVTNRSFELAIDALNRTRKLTDREPLYLEDVGLVDLDSMVNRYAMDEIYDIDGLAPYIDGQVVTSTKNDYNMHIQYRVLNASGFVGGGQQQLIFSDTNKSIFQRYWQRVETSAVNLKTKNGVIHVLSAGHDFGFSKFTTKFSTQ